MKIKQLKVSNFKSFKELDIELGQFNVLIGANASGKSNFINIFRFLRDVQTYGLDNAVSLQGGTEFLRNITVGAVENISIEVAFDHTQQKIVGESKNEVIGLKTSESIYKLVVKCTKSGLGYSVAEEQLVQKGELVVLKSFAKKRKLKEESLGRGELVSVVASGKVKTELKQADGSPLRSENKLRPFLMPEKLPPKMLLLQNPFVGSPFGHLIAVYDFDPKLPKKATPITGKAELEEDGSNLAIVLQKIIRNSARRRQFSNFAVNLLPFIDAVNVEKFADRSLIFKLKEKYFSKLYLPASSLSDGTIHIAALIVALYFEPKPVTIIEEPERNIHPHLISRLVNMMKDASRNKQLIITTQNPEVVKHAGIENLLCVSRNQEGFSNVFRPGEQKEVKTFLENEIGIETLYVQDVLVSAP